MKKIMLVGKLYKRNLNNGPGSVIKNISKEFKKCGIDYEAILVSEELEKIKFLKKIIQDILLKQNLIVNVHTEGFIIPFIVYLISKINRQNQYYLTVHGIYRIESSFSDKGKGKKLYCFLETVLYKYFPNIICVSEKLKLDIRNMYQRTSNIYVVNNGVEKTSISLVKKNLVRSDEMKFIMAGGIKDRKGILEVLEVLAYLRDVGSYNVKLLIYGKIQDDEMRKAFEEKVIQLSLEDVVVFKGLITDRNKLYIEYQKAHFNLCLSKYDTFNIAVIESMLVGCPTIMSNQCGASYLIENIKEGLVVDLNTNYKETILNFIHDICSNGSYPLLQNEAYQKAINQTWDKSSKKLISVLRASEGE